MKNEKINPFERFDKDWALLTAGTKENFNTMTISWGMMGTLWFKPVVAVFVKKSRHTFKFLEKSDTFTVSFFDNTKKDVLSFLGTVSGRDVDKVKQSGLSPKFLKNGITFEEAKEVFVCKKLFSGELELNSIPEEIKQKCYQNAKEGHYIFVGEVLENF